ncbi:hypothetical protein RM844_28995 [Streptomyces sp. DSM 44915]|uniref:Nuclear transport factor 2 family protein n=1 Tax=Streptomyces chisholmiae TaxID=3075540 RepID=A0ABU2JZ83_9ACTN|nr:hypothetical protein [Streptomyces sp. DSM 44915]MDT0270316.1 hypothetical protein [Streptomyces sp. DSM 44915]
MALPTVTPLPSSSEGPAAPVPPPAAPAAVDRLSADIVETLVRDWHQCLADRAPVALLTSDLANGLRLDLPGGVVRGLAEFRRWYAAGDHLPLAGRGVSLTDVRVRLLSPVHGELTTTAGGGAPGAAPTRQEWLVVLQDGAPRIRSVSVEPAAPAAPVAAGQAAVLNAA